MSQQEFYITDITDITELKEPDNYITELKEPDNYITELKELTKIFHDRYDGELLRVMVKVSPNIMFNKVNNKVFPNQNKKCKGLGINAPLKLSAFSLLIVEGVVSLELFLNEITRHLCNFPLDERELVGAIGIPLHILRIPQESWGTTEGAKWIFQIIKTYFRLSFKDDRDFQSATVSADMTDFFCKKKFQKYFATFGHHAFLVLGIQVYYSGRRLMYNLHPIGGKAEPYELEGCNEDIQHGEAITIAKDVVMREIKEEIGIKVPHDYLHHIFTKCEKAPPTPKHPTERTRGISFFATVFELSSKIFEESHLLPKDLLKI